MSKQLNLGELIALLEAAPQDLVVAHGFGNGNSYRGYYNQLAFEHARDARVSDMLAEARACLGRGFEGYKGGWYIMSSCTPVNIANYGVCHDDDELTAERLESMLANLSENEAAPFLASDALDNDLRAVLHEIEKLQDKVQEVFNLRFVDALHDLSINLESAADSIKEALGEGRG